MRTGNRTVLIAEDDPVLRTALSTRLTLAGFDVVTAPDGGAAIKALGRHDVDVALLGVQMPEIDGFGVCEHIRSRPDLRDIPVILLAGNATGIIRNYLAKLSDCVGGDYYLSTPCDNKSLPGVVHRAINMGTHAPAS